MHISGRNHWQRNLILVNQLYFPKREIAARNLRRPLDYGELGNPSPGRNAQNRFLPLSTKPPQFHRHQGKKLLKEKDIYFSQNLPSLQSPMFIIFSL